MGARISHTSPTSIPRFPHHLTFGFRFGGRFVLRLPSQTFIGVRHSKLMKSETSCFSIENRLEKSILIDWVKPLADMTNILYSQFAVKCHGCGNTSRTAEEFQSLSVNCCDDVAQSIRVFFNYVETLSGESAYRCMNCNANCTATKCLKLVQAPSVLCISLKRYCISPNFKFVKRNNINS